MSPFVNSHTHHLSTDGSVSIYNNRFGFDKIVYTETYFSIGIHPWDAQYNSEVDTLEFESFLKQPNCLAIGECGLDKIREAELSVQIAIFQKQLELAIKYEKPVIIHCVKAFDELQKICEPYLKQIPLMIHGFNKSQELAKQLMDKGFYLSISSEFITKANLTELPQEQLFLETDDQESLSIKEVYDLASEKLSLPQEVLKEKIYSNFTRIFYNHGR